MEAKFLKEIYPTLKWELLSEWGGHATEVITICLEIERSSPRFLVPVPSFPSCLIRKYEEFHSREKSRAVGCLRCSFPKGTVPCHVTS